MEGVCAIYTIGLDVYKCNSDVRDILLFAVFINNHVSASALTKVYFDMWCATRLISWSLPDLFAGSATWQYVICLFDTHYHLYTDDCIQHFITYDIKVLHT